MNATETVNSPVPGAEPRRPGFPYFVNERNYRIFLAVCVALWSIISYLLISHFILMAVEIKGISMSPTLLDGQHYVLFRCPYLWRSPHKGEIVVIRDPQDQGLSIKRIVGLPDELLEIRRDGVYINNVKLAEPYLTPASASASGHKLIKAMRLGREEYFVMGDNRDWSADSRIYGAVPSRAILGKINKTD